jgi:uncharacterized repeat protein (TIGR03847 family)
MAEAQHDFASVDAIDAESIGTPGKRTFRLRLLRGDDSAALWMEKQQLAALGEALPRLLEQLNTPDQHADEDAESIASFPEDPTIEFKVGRMALGYAAQEDRLVLVAHDVEAGEDESIPPTLSCRFTREQARSLSESCAEAVAGGRPICQLCHRPIDPEGHMCPRANGHQKLTRREGGEGGEA